MSSRANPVRLSSLKYNEKDVSRNIIFKYLDSTMKTEDTEALGR